ncbi:hypothetical protein JCM1840_006596 [Sporobolomyces johnsonii]
MPSSIAATRPVNPPGASPLISEAQLWAGLEFKARNPQAFVPMITSCRVVEDHGDKGCPSELIPSPRRSAPVGGQATRLVRFNDGPEVREDIHVFANTIAYFEMASSPTPTRITNLISYGPAPAHDLLLTYSFAGAIPGVGPDDARSTVELSAAMGKGVEHSIEVVRGMVRDGKL